jgi:hypothetical protein
VQGDRVRDQLLELACCQCVHGPVTGCREMSTANRRRLAGTRANSMAPERTRERPAIKHMAGPATEDKRSDTATAVSGR